MNELKTLFFPADYAKALDFPDDKFKFLFIAEVTKVWLNFSLIGTFETTRISP